MKDLIKENLTGLQREKGVKILFACESGSRAWGFHSPDSDYDVRFVYRHPTEWYLGIEDRKDFMELPINAELDISGFDIRKLLKLFWSSNPTIFEWIQSPVIYRQEDVFINGLHALVKDYFSPKVGLHHYIGLTKNTFENFLQGEALKLKKYFYALRPILAARWIVESGTCPPMQINDLRPLIADTLINEKIDHLLQLKAVVGEGYLIKPDPDLHAFISKELESCAAHASGLSRKETDPSALNVLFQKTIGIE